MRSAPFIFLFFYFFEFRPELAVSADMADSGPSRPDSGRIISSRSRVGLRRRESAKITWNPRGTTRRDAVGRSGSGVPCATLRPAASDAGAAPLVPRPCFLGDL